MELKYISSVTPLKPVNRESMQNLRAVRQDIMKKTHIESIIKYIYHAAISKATTSSSKSHKEEIGVNTRDYTMHVNNIPFERSQIPDILEKLQTLFPDCSVEHKSLSRGHDGKLYDVSKLEGVIPSSFLNRQKDQACFVIDWS